MPPRFPRPCLDCGKLSLGNRCDEHAAKQRAKYPRAPDNAKRRAKKAYLYGGDYKRRAKLVRENAVTCHLCGEGDRGPADPWEADHVDPKQGANSILLPAHRSCNRKRGNKPPSY